MRGIALAGALLLAACGPAPAATAPTATTPSAPVDTHTPPPTPAPTAAAPTVPGATPTPVPTPERTVTLVAMLGPKVSDAEGTARGSVRIVFRLERDGEAIKSATAQFDFSLEGLPSDARVQFAHIHLGTAAVEGPILLDSGLTAARFRFTNGAGSVSLPPVQCDPKLAAEILAGPAGYYFMVHSARNPDGFVRGQLRRE